MSIATAVDDPIHEMRQMASTKMGCPFYRGELWFVNAAMRWLSHTLGTFSVEYHYGTWRVRSPLNSPDSVFGETLEQAMIEAVLANDAPLPM